MKAINELIELSKQLISLTEMLGKKPYQNVQILYINPVQSTETLSVIKDNQAHVIFKQGGKEITVLFNDDSEISFHFSSQELADSKVIRNIIKDVKQQIKRGNLK